MEFNVGFIGAGRVGVTLGKYFSVNGLNLKGYYSRSEKSAKEAADFTSSNHYDDLESLLEVCNVVFITTPDDIIKKVWNKIKKYKLKDKIICHSSGSLSSSIFSDIDTLGAFGYSIHPMCAFSDKFNTYKTLYKIYFSVEGHNKYIAFLKTVFERMGNKVIMIDKNKKPLYHLASVTVSNLVLSLLDIGCSYLEDCGITKDDAINALMPLIDNNLTNIKEKGFVGALTGPVDRGDMETIRHHLEVIPKSHESLYKVLSLNLVSLAEKKHMEIKWDKIKKELGGNEDNEK